MLPIHVHRLRHAAHRVSEIQGPPPGPRPPTAGPSTIEHGEVPRHRGRLSITPGGDDRVAATARHDGPRREQGQDDRFRWRRLRRQGVFGRAGVGHPRPARTPSTTTGSEPLEFFGVFYERGPRGRRSRWPRARRSAAPANCTGVMASLGPLMVCRSATPSIGTLVPGAYGHGNHAMGRRQVRPGRVRQLSRAWLRAGAVAGSISTGRRSTS